MKGPFRAVSISEHVSLGDLDLTFIETRMLHWPDSVFTYLAQDGLLFSSDAFGMHLASGARFIDEVSECGRKYEAAKYYANILMPLSPLVSKLLETVRVIGLDIRAIASDHGPIWREDVGVVLSLYAQWAARRLRRKAVVVFDTMWESTASTARAISEALVAGGLETKLMPLSASGRSDVATEVLDAAALVVGSSTLNNNVLSRVADALTYLQGLKPRGLKGASFGSFGWSGEAVTQMRDVLVAMNVDVIGVA